MKGIRREHRGIRAAGRGTPSRAERKAEARRLRAHSHLQRVRGQLPRQTPRRRVAVVLTALAAVAGAVYGGSLAGGASWPGRRELAAIGVRGASVLPAAEIARATGLSPNADLSAVPSELVARKLESHPWIARARVVQLPSGTLLLGVTEVVPRAVLRAGSPEATYLVDDSGTPFAVAEADFAGTLPRVEVAGGATPFEPNERVARALQLAAELARRGLGEPVEIFVAAEDDRTGFSLRLADLPPRVIFGTEDLDSKLRELARVLSSDVPGLGEAAELDLRFAGQAVLRDAPSRQGAAQAATTRGRAPSST